MDSFAIENRAVYRLRGYEFERNVYSSIQLPSLHDLIKNTM